MRYIVSFAHRRYLDLQARITDDEPGFRIPEGIYRQLAVVVEADDAEEAILQARRTLGWPDAEDGLVPMGVLSQSEATAMARRRPSSLMVKSR